MLPQKTILDNIIVLTQQHPDINALWVYGSMANNTSNARSDIDLAVQFKTFIQDPEERILKPQILKIELTSELSLSDAMISIVDLDQVSTPLAWEILDTGQLLFSHNQALRIRLECRIFSQYELNVYYHRKLYG